MSIDDVFRDKSFVIRKRSFLFPVKIHSRRVHPRMNRLEIVGGAKLELKVRFEGGDITRVERDGRGGTEWSSGMSDGASSGREIRIRNRN